MSSFVGCRVLVRVGGVLGRPDGLVEGSGGWRQPAKLALVRLTPDPPLRSRQLSTNTRCAPQPAISLSVTTDSLVFGYNERGPDDDLTLAFEATRNLDPDEKGRFGPERGAVGG